MRVLLTVFVPALLLCLGAIGLSHAAELPTPVVEALASAGIEPSDISIFVQDVTADEPLLALFAQTERNPASTMKLVTTLAGLELLGPSYQWKTVAYATGELHGDVLEGDLYIKGTGDPSLTLERFAAFAADIRATGIRRIRGDLVLDRSYFDLPDNVPLSFDNHPNETYNCLPDALLVNFNSIELRISPASGQANVKSAVLVNAEPKLPQVSLVNELKPVAIACRGGRMAVRTRATGVHSRRKRQMHQQQKQRKLERQRLAVHGKLSDTAGKKQRKLVLDAKRERHSHIASRKHSVTRSVLVRARPRIRVNGDRDHATVTFSGYYATGCGESTYTTRVLGPVQYAYGAFRDLWTRSGGTIDGGLRIGKVPADAKSLAATTSEPLANIVYAINKNSNNPMAKQLFLTLGNHNVPPPATPAKAASAVRLWLQSKGLTATSLVLENGSGLSHDERISASDLGQLLLKAYHSPAASAFIDSLPLVAIDGTMRHRLRNRPVSGNAHIKTGSLRGVKAIAGYVHDRQGRTMALVFFANRPGAGAATAAQDALIEWLYDRA